ncbi:TolC family protein [Hoylesella timonensis 4401737 = DSM 22865 = JCM 15640]|uniref:TolC family protein n=1 Tax=Hoylesella timonensis TaxID=386414 RepID=UPI00048D3DFB|nr:TolC family protein [Hoylesella timonensis]
MRTAITIILLDLAALPLLAQESWTMNRCIQYAVEHNNGVRKQRLEVRQSKVDERTARLDLLPTVSAQTTAQYAWGRNINPETNTYNTITTFNNYYSIGAEVPLFDGGRTWNAFQQARLARAKSMTALQKTADDKAIAVMAKFVEAVYSQQSIGLARRKLADSQALLRKTRAMFDLGEKSRPDVAQMESQVAEDDYNLLHQQNAASLALMALKAEMNFPVGDSLALDTLLTASLSAADDAGSLYAAFQAESPEVKTAAFNVKNARYHYLIQRGQLLPVLALGGGINTNYYRNLSQGSSKTDNFGKQFNNNMGEYVYLSLSIPLFMPSRWCAARRARADWEASKLDLEDARRKLHDDIAQAVLDRDGYSRELMKMERKTAADSIAWHLASRKYEEGMLSTFDLHTAAQTLLDSRIKLLQMRLMLEMKQRLVNYYKGIRTWTLK